MYFSLHICGALQESCSHSQFAQQFQCKAVGEDYKKWMIELENTNYDYYDPRLQTRILYQKSVDVRTGLSYVQEYLWEIMQSLIQGGMSFTVKGIRWTVNGSVIDSDDSNSLDEDSNGEINVAENSNEEINSAEDSMVETSNGEISYERDYREMRNAEDSWPVDSDA